MLRKSSLLIFLVGFFVHVGGLSVSETLAAQKKSCLDCHSNIAKGKQIHPALSMGCETCHVTLEGQEHPKQKGSMRLILDMPLLCFKCHKKSNFTGQCIHPPVEKGMCDTCHDPHHSDIEELLKNEPRELCFSCHAKGKFTKKYVHPIAVGGCGKRCHSPHASDYPHLLASDISTLCISCHREQRTGAHIVALPGGKMHPLRGVAFTNNLRKEIDCTSCHNPHSSNYAKLFASKKKCRMCHKY